jgi:predicted pyridoxine 5'-phosphate oxidase superfamily flavin-nucleotide-binding protein
MTTQFHEGEIAVQTQAGVRRAAERVGPSIHSEMPEAARDFLVRQPMAIVGARDGAGRVWASLLTGEPGFLRSPRGNTVEIDAHLTPGDPLEDVWRDGTEIGLLAIEPATRRRMRVNGRLTETPQGDLVIGVHEAYANCPKYIQARTWERTGAGQEASHRVWRGERLTESQREWIGRTDTFFIATRHPIAGADASHRGGAPGFVLTRDPVTLLFPDYAGNNMFNTLGNLAADPSAGLLFVDFESGDTLQITGEARVLWDEASRAPFAGAQRVIEFHIASVVEIDGAAPLRWRFVEASPFNPI